MISLSRAKPNANIFIEITIRKISEKEIFDEYEKKLKQVKESTNINLKMIIRC